MNRPDAATDARHLAETRQRQAADPRASSWVAASAGAGKTKVLVDRVLRLLLDGAAPDHILCLTFTKAAAAEMANRLAKQLGGWVGADDDHLIAALHELTGGPVDTDVLPRARRLFAQVLEAPVGVRIETLHAFCQSMLRRFPVEAGLAPHFRVMDQRDAAEMLAAAQREVLTTARGDGDGGDDAGLAAALEVLTTRVTEEAFDALMADLARERGRLHRLIGAHGGDPEQAIAAVRRSLGLEPDETRATNVAAACADGAFDGAALARAAAAMADGAATDQRHGRAIAAWLEAAEGRPERFADYLEAFFTKGGEGGQRQRLIHADALAVLGEEGPEAVETLATEAERLFAARERIRAAGVAESTAAMLRLGGAVLAVYQRHKAERAGLDYDDLILEARNLLMRPGVAPWVLFKLDGGIDHILIDEAQDTSPEQWEVVQALADEFFAGEGAREAARTVFAVGDTKQSIFSIQRADPASFERMRRHFAARVADAGLDWRLVRLDVSFRSSEAVLAAVDLVFGREAARDGLLFGDGEIHHIAERAGVSGTVEVWPPVEPAVAPDPEPWAPPLVGAADVAPAARLARHIARTIRGWLDSGENLASEGRPIRPDDIMVLVRRRAPFVDELVRALKDLRVPVAGVDRMVLAEQIAVMDLIALGRFLLLPEDDLTLATVLKGPLVGLGEDELFALAYGREGEPLWRVLRRRAGQGEPYRSAYETLAGLLAGADFVPPYEMYADILGAGGGRRALLARLGPDAEDPIDEFLALALAHGRAHAPSLEGFLHWLEAGRTEVKRDLERSLRDEVRVMTVHGAKGLEAPIVFLPDTMQMPPASRAPLLWPEDLWPEEGGGEPLWLPRRADEDALARRVREAADRRREQEYRRLLYVAMTRAADRLYVCGWRTRNQPPEGCWYGLVTAALAGAPGVERLELDLGDGWAGPGYRITSGVPRQTAARRPRRAPPPESLPDWAHRPPAAEPSPPRPLAPSRPEGDEPPVRSPLGPDGGARFRRGVLIHRLLESLPELPEAEREPACRTYLARPVHRLGAAEREEIAAEVMGVLSDAAFAAFFGPDSIAEAPLAGQVGARAVSGRVDRLLVTGDRVGVLDFKTNRPPPARAEEVPEIYLRQMAAYKAVLRIIYPNKSVTCALLWTDGPRLMELDDAILDPHAP